MPSPDELDMMLRAAPSILDPEGALALAQRERRIERGLQSFVDVGRALAEIRDGRLYLHGYASFEAYCDHRWNLSRKRAYDLMSAATVVDGMEAAIHMAVSPIGDTQPLPVNEGQARELARLDPSDAVEVMQEVYDETAGRPTAAAIRDAVARRQDSGLIECSSCHTDHDPDVVTEMDEQTLLCPTCLDEIENVAVPNEVNASNSLGYRDPKLLEKTSGSREPEVEGSADSKPKARRAPITEAFWKAAYDFRKRGETLTRLVSDDRLKRNKDQIAGANLGDLIRVRDDLNKVIELLQEG